MLKAAQAYFQTQVNTTSQGDLLLMLYDGALKYLHQAKAKIEEKDYAGKGVLISKALDVVAELDGSLNAQKGGDLAEKLHNLYFFCTMRLFNANLKMDTKLIDEVILILSGLRDAYGQIVKNQGGTMPAPGDVPAPPPASKGFTPPPPAAAPKQSRPMSPPPPAAPPAQGGKPLARITPKKVPADQAIPGSEAQAPRPAASPKPNQAQAGQQPAQPVQQPMQTPLSPNPRPRMGRGANMYKKMSEQKD